MKKSSTDVSEPTHGVEKPNPTETSNSDVHPVEKDGKKKSGASKASKRGKKDLIPTPSKTVITTEELCILGDLVNDIITAIEVDHELEAKEASSTPKEVKEADDVEPINNKLLFSYKSPLFGGSLDITEYDRVSLPSACDRRAG